MKDELRIQGFPFQQLTDIAIDILLVPDATMLPDHAEAVDAGRLKVYRRGPRLRRQTHNPHVTMIQRFIPALQTSTRSMPPSAR